MKHFFEIINSWIFSYMAQMGFILFESDVKLTVEQLKGLADRQAELAKEVQDSKNFRAEMRDKCLDLERKMSSMPPSGVLPTNNLADVIFKSDAAKVVREKTSRVAGMTIEAKDLFGGLETKNTIVNSTNVMASATRNPEIVSNAQRRLLIRQLLPVGIATSNSVETTRELVFTNNAGAQYASPATEGSKKSESGITFDLVESKIVTIAHFLKASRQVLDDQPQLANFLQQRLIYGVELKLEDQLLNGLGTNGNMSGLLKSGNFTAFNAHVTGDTKVDTLRRAIGQLEVNDFLGDVIIINPVDWAAIELTKETTNGYVWAQAQQAATPMLWGMNVISTNSIAQGKFLVGALAQSAMFWVRQEARVEIGSDSDDFTKNLLTILAECRAGISIFRPAGIISGSL